MSAPNWDTTVKVYAYLKDRADENGLVLQSIRDIAHGLGYKSKSGAHFHVLHLERMGIIIREPHTQGCIKLAHADLSDEVLHEMLAATVRSPWGKDDEEEEEECPKSTSAAQLT